MDQAHVHRHRSRCLARLFHHREQLLVCVLDLRCWLLQVWILLQVTLLRLVQSHSIQQSGAVAWTASGAIWLGVGANSVEGVENLIYLLLVLLAQLARQVALCRPTLRLMRVAPFRLAMVSKKGADAVRLVAAARSYFLVTRNLTQSVQVGFMKPLQSTQFLFSEELIRRARSSSDNPIFGVRHDTNTRAHLGCCSTQPSTCTDKWERRKVRI